MLHCFTDHARGAVPITPVTPRGFARWRGRQPARVRTWLDRIGFAPRPGRSALVPGTDGRIQRVIVSVHDGEVMAAFGALARRLPRGTYRLDGRADAVGAAIGWGLGPYRFTRYRKKKTERAVLVWPSHAAREAAGRAVSAT